MGTDIHTVAEVCVDGRWRPIVGELEDGERDYATFFVLAGVRYLEGLDPIDSPRGLPADFQQHLVDEDRVYTQPERGEAVWLGEHSHSWLLLSELLAFWEATPAQDGMRRAWVTREVYRALVLRSVMPREVCHDVEGARDPRLDDPQADPYRILLDNSWTYVETGWAVRGRRCFELFPTLVERLQELRQEFGLRSDQVRLVFGFDS